jgi:hypothetical protein
VITPCAAQRGRICLVYGTVDHKVERSGPRGILISMRCDLTVSYFSRVENIAENDQRLFAACKPGKPMVDGSASYDAVQGLRQIRFAFQSKKVMDLVIRGLTYNAEQTDVPYSVGEGFFEFLGNQGCVNG